MNKLARSLLVVSIFVGGLVPVSPAWAACTSPYKVQSGDSLYKIAVQCGTTVAAIQSANGMTGTIIFVGQQLNIPGAAGAPASNGSPAASAAGGSYTVQSGDTLYGIAVKFGTTVNAIKSANGLSSNTIRIGQVLKVLGGGSGAPV